VNDVRHALRSLRRTPAISLLAVLTLAVGIGGSTAIFTVVNSVLIEALPYPGADRIVMISEANERTRTMGVSNPNFEDWHAAARSFSAMAAWSGGRSTVVGGTEPVVAGVFVVTREFFRVMGISPVVGARSPTRRPDRTGRRRHREPWPLAARARRPRRPDGAHAARGRRDGVGRGRHAARASSTRPARSVWVPKERTPDPSGRTAHNLRVVARIAPTA
jgi:putative ABC transport system permease protein